MKSLKFKIIVLMVMFFTGIAMIQPAFCQKKERVRMKLTYIKDQAGDRVITATLTAGSGKSMHGVSNGTINLSIVLGDSLLNLANLQTDTLGSVMLHFETGVNLPLDEEGITTISGSYEGDETYNSASGELQIKDAHMEMAFEERDSIKYLTVTASQSNAAGEVFPVEELDINIGVQRLFSVLPIGKVTTDADGWAEVELPNDIPGDSLGNLTFVAHIDEHDLYGTVTTIATKDWGVPVSYEVKPLPRQLFTDEAPFWMIASVFIILLGAWYHFFLSVSKLIKLKKAV